MAEPMDPTPIDWNNVEEVVGTWEAHHGRDLGAIGRDSLVFAIRRIRDAATAAERQRCIAYLEQAAAEALTVNLGNVLRRHANALRGGDHE